MVRAALTRPERPEAKGVEAPIEVPEPVTATEDEVAKAAPSPPMTPVVEVHAARAANSSLGPPTALAPHASGMTATPVEQPFSPPPLVAAELEAVRCSHALEQHVLQAADEAFKGEQPARALRMLEQHHQQCPTGEWPSMSWGLRIKSLCALSRHQEARALFEWYAADHPNETRRLQAEVDNACPQLAR